MACTAPRRSTSTRLRSAFGYVLDHATPIGEIVIASPTPTRRIVAELHGRAAHAGIRPEEGRSAIAAAGASDRGHAAGAARRRDHRERRARSPAARATNVVPERCRIEAEVRGLDDERVEAVVTEMIDHLQDAAERGRVRPRRHGRADVPGYRTKPRAPEIVLAERALRACGYEPRHDRHRRRVGRQRLRGGRLPCANLANGTERNHQPDERVSVDALEGMLEVAIALDRARPAAEPMIASSSELG